MRAMLAVHRNLHLILTLHRVTEVHFPASARSPSDTVQTRRVKIHFQFRRHTKSKRFTHGCPADRTVDLPHCLQAAVVAHHPKIVGTEITQVGFRSLGKDGIIVRRLFRTYAVVQIRVNNRPETVSFLYIFITSCQLPEDAAVRAKQLSRLFHSTYPRP